MKTHHGQFILWKTLGAAFFMVVVSVTWTWAVTLPPASTPTHTAAATPLPSAPPTPSPEPLEGEVPNPSHVWTPQVLSVCASAPVYGRPDPLAVPLYTLPRHSYVIPREWIPGWLMIQPAHWMRDNVICHPENVDWWALKRPR